jgi:hydrogenase maturation protease
VNQAGALIVGYGNPLRGDDGIGWHAARLLATAPWLDGGRVLARHQLTPELAEDVGRASLVVLVDAAAEGNPGSVSVRRIGSPPPTPITWSHHLSPETLAGLAEALYGTVPPIVLVSVAAESFAEGDGLSSALKRALPDVVEAIVGVVNGTTNGPDGGGIGGPTSASVGPSCRSSSATAGSSDHAPAGVGGHQHSMCWWPPKVSTGRSR